MNPFLSSLKGHAKTLNGIVAAILAFLSTILLFREKLASLLESKFWIYIFAVFDAFKYECIALLVLVLCYKRILTLFDAITSQIRRRRRRKRPIVTRISLFALYLVLFGAIAYQGYYYILGRKIHLAQYDKLLSLRASNSLSKGHYDTARRYHRIGVSAGFMSSRLLIENLEHRLNLTSQLQSLYSAMPLDSRKHALLQCIKKLEGNHLFYQNHAHLLEEELHKLQTQYAAAIIKIKEEQFTSARQVLQEIQDTFPGFLDCHFIIEELKDQISGATTSTPYLAAINALKVDDFIDQLQPTLKDTVQDTHDQLAYTLPIRHLYHDRSYSSSPSGYHDLTLPQPYEYPQDTTHADHDGEPGYYPRRNAPYQDVPYRYYYQQPYSTQGERALFPPRARDQGVGQW